ncbi:MAG: ComF family protein [Patescibacteria group bacterium]|nr:ComF family protein [Patescibacteria group bacterium]
MDDKTIKSKLLNLLFPVECAGCGKEDVWLCPDCLLKLPLGRNTACFFCGKDNSFGSTCPACAANYNLDGVFVCADYSDRVVNELIKKLKYSFARELGEVLAAIAGRYLEKLAAEEKLKNINLRKFIVTPIPLHRKRYNWRGFNQAEIIANHFAKRASLACQDTLIRVKHKMPQAKLDGAARRQNITGCFAPSGENLSGKKILLVDDVATTGSTLNEAAGILKSAGAGKVWGLVIAKG